MSKEKRGPRGPRGFQGEPGLTGATGPTGAPGRDAISDWGTQEEGIGPGLHVRCWRDAVSGERQYSIVRVTAYNDGSGNQINVADQTGNQVLTDFQVASSYFMRFS
jgi:hypothetical protein